MIYYLRKKYDFIFILWFYLKGENNISFLHGALT